MHVEVVERVVAAIGLVTSFSVSFSRNQLNSAQVPPLQSSPTDLFISEPNFSLVNIRYTTPSKIILIMNALGFDKSFFH